MSKSDATETTPEILTSKQASAFAGFTGEDAFKYLRLKGSGPTYIRVGRTIRYFKADVVTWLEAQRIDPAA